MAGTYRKVEWKKNNKSSTKQKVNMKDKEGQVKMDEVQEDLGIIS